MLAPRGKQVEVRPREHHVIFTLCSFDDKADHDVKTLMEEHGCMG